ncbi:hypothetical protein ACQH7H_24705, partial [Escherichia coli]|uniref:hypothetical protein n=4 Tax=Bacteria TaxID=2 RepID=UPI003CEB66ED
KLYDAILYLVKICPQLDYHYICSKLSIEKVENKEELGEEIEQLKRKAVKEAINGGKMDMLFRVLGVLVRDTLSKITEEDIAKVISFIQNHITSYNTLKLVESQWT